MNPNPASDADIDNMEIARASTEEKETQIRNLQTFWSAHEEESEAAIARLQEVAVNNGNIFAELMESVKVASLGQITKALYEVGGQYRRNM